MKNQRKKFENDMRKLLRLIATEGSISKTENINMEALKECCDKNYISGIYAPRMMSGQIVVEETLSPRITKSGLDFLHPKHDVKFIVSSSIPIASLFLNIMLVIF